MHVWGGISRRGPTNLLIFDGIMDGEFYLNKIMKDVYTPSAAILYPDMPCHMWADNDPKHRYGPVFTYMEEQGINWFRTAESPDMNPIEMAWNGVKVHVAKDCPTTQEDLKTAIADAWENHLSVRRCNKYISRNYKALKKVVEVKGGYTGM